MQEALLVCTRVFSQLRVLATHAARVVVLRAHALPPHILPFNPDQGFYTNIFTLLVGGDIRNTSSLRARPASYKPLLVDAVDTVLTTFGRPFFTIPFSATFRARVLEQHAKQV